MTITLNGTTGVVAPEFDGPLDASNLTGALPAIDGSAVTSLTASNLTGALPAIDGSALTGISTTPTTAQVLTATAGASVGAVGTYAFLRGISGSGYSAGSTRSGSSLYYTDALRSYSGSPSAGTWMCMGYGQYYDRPTVWLRIS